MPADTANRAAPPDQPSAARRPVTLVAATAALAVQVGAFLALAIAVAVGPGSEGATYPVVAFAAVMGLLLALVAVSLWRRRRWACSAAIAWGVLIALVGLSQLGWNLPVAIAVALVGIATAGLAFLPSTRRAMVGGVGLEDED